MTNEAVALAASRCDAEVGGSALFYSFVTYDKHERGEKMENQCSSIRRIKIKLGTKKLDAPSVCPEFE